MDKYSFMKEFSDLNTIVFQINRSMQQAKDGGCFQCVSMIQLHTLMILRTRGKLNMTELAGELFMTRQQLTKLVATLEDKGFVTRTTNPDNRRQVIIGTTKPGSELIDKMLEANTGRLIELLEKTGEEDGQRMLDAIITIKEVLGKVAQRLTENQAD